MLVAAALVIPDLILEGAAVGPGWKALASILNWGTWLAFVAELVAMLTPAPLSSSGRRLRLLRFVSMKEGGWSMALAAWG